MLGRVLGLIVKEFLAILKDPKSRFVVIGPPIIQMLIFGYAATYDLSDVRMAVYDEDHSGASRELLARFLGSPTFHEVCRITHQEEIAPLMDRRDVLMVLHVPPRFSEDLLAGRGATVQALVDGRNSNTALVALGYARTITADFSEQWATERGLPPPPARLEVRSWYNPNQESRWFIVPGIVGILTLVVVTVTTAMSVARERENGTFDQLLVTPLRPVEILIGKAAPGLVIGLFEASLIILVAVFWFHVPLRGSLLTLYAAMFLFLLSVIGMGLMISSLSATMQQALLGSFMFITPAIILSGFTTPIANMPAAVQYITLFNPMRHFITIVRGVFLEGATLDLLVHQLWPMALIAAVTLTLAAWLFRHRMSTSSGS